MKMIEAFKEDINNSLKEIQEHTIKQVKELNKIVQELKMEIETNGDNLRDRQLKKRDQKLKMQASPTEYKRWKR